jgi:VanZ family protein
MIPIIKLIRPFAKYLMIVWLLTILTVSSIPYIPTIRIHTANNEFRLDYLMHFCEYGLLAFLTFFSFTDDELRIGFRKGVIILFSLMLFAYLDELHQKLIPGRTYNINDILSNLSGIVAGALFTYIVFRSIRKGIIKNSDIPDN